MSQTHFVQTYLDDLKSLLDAISHEQIDAIVETLFEAWQQGKRVVMMANGGSSSSVSHITNDLQKNLQLEAGKALRALCLTDNAPVLIAWANDTSWENVFAPQIECWIEPGDVAIGISGSGNSQNVLNGMARANELGAKTVGFAGYGGGKLAGIAQNCLVVHSNNMQRVEDVHMVALHLIFSALMKRACESVGRS